MLQSSHASKVDNEIAKAYDYITSKISYCHGIILCQKRVLFVQRSRFTRRHCYTTIGPLIYHDLQEKLISEVVKLRSGPPFYTAGFWFMQVS
jgi:hypothetical protein